ncbi:MAG: hypothetical protein JXA77_01355 [Bacteroidales bacterium]|nr:hypothetical protein [Bacteroidales bacterium]MBN2820174.1 hypothetical protein [Bacteroidales bacterium]
MNKYLFIIVMSSLFTANAFCQDDDFYSLEGESKNEKNEKKALEKWAFGGNLGLSFGYLTYIDISPLALYRATPRLQVGPGFTYNYINYKSFNYKTSSYGPRAIVMYTLLANLDEKININIGNIVVYSELEHVNIEKYYIHNNSFVSIGREWIDNVLVGAGIFQPFGEHNGGLSLLVLFDVTQNPYSSYSNPTIRLGFYF